MFSPPRTLFYLCAMLLLWGGHASAQTTTVDFQDGVSPSADYSGTEDTLIKQQSPDLNLGTVPKVRVTTNDIGGGAAWTLMRWDISAHVPPGAVVTDVQITLYVDPDDPGPSIPIYQLLRPWTEGNGSEGGTWNRYDGVNTWQSAGAEGAADRGSTSLGTMPGSSGFQTAVLSATGRSVVQGWIDDPTTNNGFILRGGSFDGVDYASRENLSPAQHPRLRISYALPTFPPPASTTVTFRDGESGYAGTTDTRLRSNNSSNYGSSNNLRVDSNGNQWRSLIRWDLSSIPSGASVTDARLSLYCYNTGNSGTLYELLRDWEEGNSSSGSGADWFDYASPASTDWGTAGANGVGTDRNNTVLGTLPAAAGDQTAVLNASGRSVVQNWIQNPSSNNGFGIYPTGTNESRWRSRNHGTTSQRPQISISYTLGGLTRTATSNGAWNNPATWSPAGVPGVDERVVIDGATVTLSGGGSHTATRVEVINGGRLEVSNGTLTSSGLVGVLPGSTLSVQGGTLRCLGRTLVIGSQLSVSSGSLLLGGQPLWLGAASTLTTSGGLIAADNAGTPMSFTVHGVLQAAGVTIRNPVAAGFQVSRAARIEYLRDLRFEGVAAGAGSRLLSIEQDAFCLSAPRVFFEAVAADQHSVRIRDANPSTADDVALNFEDRGDAINGAGADPSRELEENGAAVNWVHSAPDSTSGTNVGFPQVAYDLNTFAYYATYVAFRDVDPAGTDRIHVFDPDGEGVDQGYYFEIPASAGDLVEGFWWDQQDTARVLWVTTTTGRVFRFTNTGSGSGAIAPDVGFPTTIPSTVFTTSALTADSSLLYAAGTQSGSPRFFAINATDGTLAWAVSTGLPDPITSQLGSELVSGVTAVFAGGGQITSGGTVFFTEDFNGNSGPFSYQDDTFRGTNSPGQASGDYSTSGGVSGGRVRVRLGPFGSNMSGGWRGNFVVPGAAPSLVEVRFSYRLISGDRYEFDEFQQIMASVDGNLLGVGVNDYVFQYVGDGNGGANLDTGWATAAFRLTLTPGSHQLTLGGFSNKSTESIEVVQALFDNLELETVNSTGRIYRVNTQTQLVELEDGTPTGPITGSVLPAFGFGLFAVDQNGSVHGIESTTMTPLAGWPVQTGTPLRSDVWMDYFSGEVFFGNETGQLFGYTYGGAPISGFPLGNPFGNSGAVRASPLFDSGLLWASNEAGRVIAVDTSAASVVSPDYRFGGRSSRVSQDSSGRITLGTACGQYLVLLPTTDPTP